jgi:transcriptional regulator with XRE-family HTH domain
MRAALDSAGLRRECARRGLTGAELAQIAGVTEATVSHVLNGRMASYTTIRKLARALTITPPLPGSDGIIGTQKAAIEPPLVAAGGFGGSASATSAA